MPTPSHCAIQGPDSAPRRAARVQYLAHHGAAMSARHLTRLLNAQRSWMDSGDCAALARQLMSRGEDVQAVRVGGEGVQAVRVGGEGVQAVRVGGGEGVVGDGAKGSCGDSLE